MLHRSFKPAKCKTSLKLATSRIKLLKNKKGVQLKQLKRELAQLLESGQDQTARIRVEHVVREEKTIAAYDLLEIYCELIAARLPIIESQKNCPIDMKEAITSVIFASPRCADIPELLDVRKHFTAKYGKEFISAAVELRPDCGVSRMLVEKLSAKAPDGQTKIKILSAIAEEHNVKWDPNSFGEKELKPPDDLLNGPTTFEKASKMQKEPPIDQSPPSIVQAHPRPDQKQNAPVNFEHNGRSSTDSLNFASTDVGGAQATMPAVSHAGVRPSGTGSERMEGRYPYSGDGNAFSMGRQNSNMEFKDATAAAQAAAESAERASMAARAAVELSSRGKITRQYSTESQKSNIYSSRDEGPTKNAASKLSTEQFAKSSGYNFQRRDPQIRTEQVGGHEHDDPDETTEKVNRNGHGSTKRSTRSASLRSSTASVDDAKFDIQKGDRYSQNSSFEEEAVKLDKSAAFSGMSMKKQSIGSDKEFVSSRQGDLQSDNFNYFAEESIRKQTSSVTSHSHSSNHGDDYDASPSSHLKFDEFDGGEDPFVSIGQGYVHRDHVQTGSYNNAAEVFDESVSDDDDFKFDTGPEYDRQESKYSTSPGREPPSHLPLNTDTWIPRQNISGSLEKSSSALHVSAEWHLPPKFDESLTKATHPSQPDNFLPVTFDESEGPSSESEDELEKYMLGGKTDPTSLPHKETIFSRNPDDIQSESHGLTGSFFTEKGDSVSNRKQDLHYFSDDKELVEEMAENNQGTEFGAQSRKKFGFDEVPTRQSSAKLAKSQISNDMASEPFYNQVEERKNKQSPQTSRLSLVNEVKATERICTPESSDTTKDDELFEQSSLESGKELNFGTLTGGLRNKGYRHPPYVRNPSGDASSSKEADEDRVTAVENSPASPAVKSYLKSGVSTKVKNKSSSRTLITNYDSGTDDSEEELPQQNSRSKREPDSPKASKEVNTKSRLRAPVTFFDSDGNDSEKDLPKQTFTGTGRAGSGFSRRTKATASSSKATVNSDADARKMPSRSSYRSESPPKPHTQTAKLSSYRSESPPKPHTQTAKLSSHRSETPPKPQRQTAKSGHREISPGPSAAKQATSKPMSKSNTAMRKENLKSSATEQPSSPLKTVTSASSESPKISTSSKEAPSRESSLTKASHVHPKLPDYDTIAAQLESLRLNRQ